MLLLLLLLFLLLLPLLLLVVLAFRRIADLHVFLVSSLPARLRLYLSSGQAGIDPCVHEHKERNTPGLSTKWRLPVRSATLTPSPVLQVLAPTPQKWPRRSDSGVARLAAKRRLPSL